MKQMKILNISNKNNYPVMLNKWKYNHLDLSKPRIELWYLFLIKLSKIQISSIYLYIFAKFDQLPVCSIKIRLSSFQNIVSSMRKNDSSLGYGTYSKLKFNLNL